jgi:hypothetical protein
MIARPSVMAPAKNEICIRIVAVSLETVVIVISYLTDQFCQTSYLAAEMERRNISLDSMKDNN